MTDEETAEIIASWSDDIIQKEFEGPRNKDAFEKLSNIEIKGIWQEYGLM